MNNQNGMPKKNKPLTVQELAAMGGKARAKALSKKQRSESARKAVQKRWEKKTVSTTRKRSG